MSETIQDFVPEQLDLISSGQEQYIFNETLGDYVRVAVFDENEEWIVGYEYYSNIDFDGNYIDYELLGNGQEITEFDNPMCDGDIPIISNIGSQFYFESATQYCIDNGYESYEEGSVETYEMDGNACFWNGNEWVNNAGGGINVIHSINCIRYNQTYPTPVQGTFPQVNIYRNNADIYFKPNEILTQNQTAGGNYQLKFDFLRNYFDTWLDYFITNGYIASTGYVIDITSSYFSTDYDITTLVDDLIDSGEITNEDGDDFLDLVQYVQDVYFGDPNFYIKEISASRKEIRVYGRYGENNNIYFDEDFINEFIYILGSLNEDCGAEGKPQCYKLNYVLNIGQGKAITINNYAFDYVTDSENPSLVLRLNKPLPTSIFQYYAVNIERKLIDSHIENILYVSNISSMMIGDGLEPDFNYSTEIYNDTTDDTHQNQLQLEASASINQETFDEIAIENTNQYKNLNINFSNFKNHVFFGSAVSKLENFKSKAVTIENHIREISSSLTLTGSHVEERRKELFGNITEVKKGFTPYEKFMYYDNQSTSTGSAPGIGPNLIDAVPVSERSPTTILPQYEGIKLVYKHTSKNAGTGESDIHIFSKKYRVEETPFFNTNEPIYLSFLIKGTDSIATTANATSNGLNWVNMNQYNSLPSSSFQNERILNPTIKHNEYRRHIYAASQSYWRPIQDGEINGDIANITDWSTNSTQFQILSASNITGSYPINDSSGQIGELLYPSMYNTSSQYGYLDTVTERSGSVLPSGELFNIKYHSGSNAAGAATSSFTTDIFVSTKDPRNVPPFSILYPTGSSEWTNWYDEQYTSASNYDTDNVNSLIKNLPSWIDEESETAVLKSFVNMWGEQFDLTKNHIDNYSNIHKRNYTKHDSVPNNLLPIIGNNLGWEFISPYSSSLAEYFSNASYGQHSTKHVVNDVWNRVLNNLIYIFKTKGTQNSVNALLNSYGIPPELIRIRETIQGDGNVLSNNLPDNTGIDGSSIDGVFFPKPYLLHGLMFGPKHGNPNGILKLPWNTNDANGDTVEFIFNPLNLRNSRRHGVNTQTLLMSSGSDNQNLWDMQLIPSASFNNYAKIQFRLNNSPYGSGSISNNAVSMSTSYLNFKDIDYTNVLLQSMTASISGTGIQEYRMYVGALQDSFDKRIKNWQVISMSVSGGLVADNNTNTGDGKGNLEYQANFNFTGTGSNNAHVSGNLILGNTFTGSLAEFRVWKSALSASKFKLHIMDKTNVVGNTINSYKNDIIYRFKLSENYRSGSKSRRLISTIDDRSNVKYTINYVPVAENHLRYSVIKTNLYKFAPQLNQDEIITDNKIIIKPDEIFVNPLSPYHKSVQKIDDGLNATRKQNNKIKISKSPTAVIDDYISSQLASMDVESKFADPRNIYSGSYNELETLRNEVLKDVKVDVNKYIRKNSKIFNNSFITSIKKILPAKGEIDEFGIVIEPDMLNKSKFKQQSIKINPLYNKFNFSVSEIQANVFGGKYFEKQTNKDKLKYKEIIKTTGKIPLIKPTNIGITKTYYSTITGSVLPKIDDFIISASKISRIGGKKFDNSVGKINLYKSGSNVFKLKMDTNENTNTNFGLNMRISGSNVLKIKNKVVNPYKNDISFKSGSYNAFRFRQSVQDVHDIIISGSNSLKMVSEFISTNKGGLELSGSKILPEIKMSDALNPRLVLQISGSTAFKLNSKYIDDKSKTLFFSGSTFITNMEKIHTHLLSISGGSTAFKLNSKYIDDKSSTMYFSGSVFNTGMEKIKQHLISISGSNAFKLNSKYISDKDNSITFSGSKMYSISMTDMTSKTSLKVSELSGSKPKIGSTYMAAYSASTAPFRTKGYYSRLPWEDEWGNDVKVLSGRYRLHSPDDKILDVNWDSGVYNRTFTYFTIGDIEYVSRSVSVPNEPGGIDSWEGRLYTGYEFNTDYSDHKYFKRRRLVDNGKGYQYRGYINGESEHRIDARPIGRTAYFATSSTNEILYPDNHYKHFPTSKGNSRLYYIGSQFASGSFSCIYPTQNNYKPYDPLPAVPFYTYKVDGASADTKLEVVNKNTIKNKKSNVLKTPKKPNSN
jgi:hypothetical protein